MSKELIELKTINDIANQYFPGANVWFLHDVIWSYTGYPEFWTGDPEACFRRQLKEAAESLEKGMFYDLEKGWICLTD